MDKWECWLKERKVILKNNFLSAGIMYFWRLFQNRLRVEKIAKDLFVLNA